MQTVDTVPPGCEKNALRLAARKRPSSTDPLIGFGRHFGRTVHALTNVHLLILNGLARESDLANLEDSESGFAALPLEERREHTVYRRLLEQVPGLEDRLLESNADEVKFIAALLSKGAAGARADDTKSLKGVILDWITPRGESLNPPLSRNTKCDRGFNHERTGSLLCPADLDWRNVEVREKLKNGEIFVGGDQWPIFLYEGYRFDPEEPWTGAFRSALLVTAFKHIFTSPSSVEKENKATRAGNARKNGMIKVTTASIAYVATQVRFALSSASVFSRTDTATDSEKFYNTIYELFEDPLERSEVTELLLWWNRKIFPNAQGIARQIGRAHV